MSKEQTDLDAWDALSCDDQFALARRIAANVGYVLVPEPSIQDAEDAAAEDQSPAAWLHPEARWAHVNRANVAAHCRKNGPQPIPLYASPSPAGGVQGVTDEMVERALAADLSLRKFLADDDRGGELAADDHHVLVEVMSTLRSLTAALSSQAQTTGGVDG